MSRPDHLPRPAEELEGLAAHYDTHDTSSEMEDGEWVDPQPMRTTSLRLPSDVVDSLKSLARSRGQRYTAYVRELLEQAVAGTRDDAVLGIERRLARIEEVVTAKVSATPRRKVAATRRRSSFKARKVAGGRGLIAGRGNPHHAGNHRAD